MSGGSLDYVYRKVEEAADKIRENPEATTLHKAFAAHLDLVAEALRSLEREQSGDFGPGDADGHIRAVIGGWER